MMDVANGAVGALSVPNVPFTALSRNATSGYSERLTEVQWSWRWSPQWCCRARVVVAVWVGWWWEVDFDVEATGGLGAHVECGVVGGGDGGHDGQAEAVAVARVGSVGAEPF